MDNGNRWPGYYITAYGIAVKHGFRGTEEEWLKSLVGADGKSAYKTAQDGGYLGTEEDLAQRLAMDYAIWAHGMSAKNDDNSDALLAAITEATENGNAVYIPAGTYVFTDPITLPDGVTVELIGASDAFSNSMNRELVGTEYHTKVSGTTLIYRGEGAMFRHRSCVFKLKNLSLVSQDEDKKYLYNATVIGQKVVESARKGKIYAENCLFAGWKTVAGDPYVTAELESALGGNLAEPDTPEQCCIVATRCRFSFCGCAVNMMVDGRLDDCAINKCWYGANFYGNAGFTTLANTRIEWCVYDGVIANGSHDVLITGCEFDRCGYAAVRMNDCDNCSVIGNTMRRSGADTDLAVEDNINNLHIYVHGCTGGVIADNTTVKKNTSDAGTGKTRPTNAYNIEDCEYLIIANNYLLGRNTGTYDNYNNNTNCKLTGNVGLDNDQDGADGETPYIGDNGNWWIGETDTGVQAQGGRGTGILTVNTEPTKYYTETAGKLPVARMALSTITEASGTDEVLVGDVVRYIYRHYHIYHIDDTYAYMDSYVTLRGDAGGYYTPSITQPDENTIEIAFEASNNGIPAVAPVQVALPAGSGSGQNGNGLTTTEKNHLLTILDAVILETSRQPVVAEALNALKSLWSGGEVYVSQNGTTLTLNNVTAVTSITQTGTVLALA